MADPNVLQRLAELERRFSVLRFSGPGYKGVGGIEVKTSGNDVVADGTTLLRRIEVLEKALAALSGSTAPASRALPQPPSSGLAVLVSDNGSVKWVPGETYSC